VSLLSMFQRVCNEVGLPEPTLIVSSTDRQVKQLLATTYRVGNDIKGSDWNKLQREASITLVDGQESYALPADFDVELSETEWDSTNDWPLIGPLSPSEWQALKNNTISSSEFERKFRIKGTALKTLYIDPIPDSNNAGDVLLFEYLSQNWIRPKTWTASTVFTAGSYCFYDGVYFSTVAGGTTGATPPTTLALNDGGITWVEFTGVYSFTADTDEFILDEDLVGLGVQWNYLASKGLPYVHLQQKYNQDISSLMAQSAGTETISLVPRYGLFSNGYRNYRIIP
jgi:hypothetical protein